MTIKSHPTGEDADGISDLAGTFRRIVTDWRRILQGSSIVLGIRTVV
jgi:HAMP domain-containing protein